MSVNRAALKRLLGDVDVTAILISFIKQGHIGKIELRRFADVLGLRNTYNSYKDKDPFDIDVAIALLTDLLDQESIT